MRLPNYPSSGRQTGSLPALEVYLRSIHAPCVATRRVHSNDCSCKSRPPLQYTCAHTTRRKTNMGTKFSTLFRCTNSKRILTAIGAFALLAFLLGISPQPALAQSGVDNSTASGVFQLEGDAQRTGTICWLPVASGG